MFHTGYASRGLFYVTVILFNYFVFFQANNIFHAYTWALRLKWDTGSYYWHVHYVQSNDVRRNSSNIWLMFVIATICSNSDGETMEGASFVIAMSTQLPTPNNDLLLFCYSIWLLNRLSSLKCILFAAQSRTIDIVYCVIYFKNRFSHFKWTKLRLVNVYFCYITKWVRSMHSFFF